MIESRYKIEYVTTEEKIVKETSALKMLCYVLLCAGLILVVTAIKYDFTFKDIANNSSTIISKAKKNILNLEEIGSKPVKAQIIQKRQTQVVSAKKTEIKTPIEKLKDTPYKKIIKELSQKQKQQLAKNSELASTLSSISAELTLEKTKNETLNTKLTAQEQDTLELEQQLNQILEQSDEDRFSLEELTALYNEKIIIQDPEVVKTTDKKKDTEANSRQANTTSTVELVETPIESKKVENQSKSQKTTVTTNNDSLNSQQNEIDEISKAILSAKNRNNSKKQDTSVIETSVIETSEQTAGLDDIVSAIQENKTSTSIQQKSSAPKSSIQIADEKAISSARENLKQQMLEQNKRQ